MSAASPSKPQPITLSDAGSGAADEKLNPVTSAPVPKPEPYSDPAKAPLTSVPVESASKYEQ
jgi:hypothetical protein